MKHSCINCHFLGKRHSHLEPDEGLAFVLSQSERIDIKSGKIKKTTNSYIIKCLKNVWHQGSVQENGKSLFEEIISEKRNNRCFFYKYDNGTSFIAAEELQKRTREFEQMKRSNLYTQIALIIAAIGLFITAFTELLKDIF